jgi:hypothetical protein
VGGYSACDQRLGEPMTVSSREVSVRRFLETARRHRAELARGLGWPDGPDLLKRLVERAGGGWVSKRGVAGNISYTIHGGVGCRLCLENDHTCVDGDLLPDGSFSFDLWRIRQYAESIGVTVPPDDVLENECRALVRGNVLRALGKNWYAASV